MCSKCAPLRMITAVPILPSLLGASYIRYLKFLSCPSFSVSILPCHNNVACLMEAKMVIQSCSSRRSIILAWSSLYFNNPSRSSLYSPIPSRKKEFKDRTGQSTGEMEEQVEMVGRAFVQHYYHLFDNERASLAALYQPTSMLTFEGQRFLGTEEISAKLINLPFESCHHAITTIDCQPSSFNGGIIVFVSGRLQLGGEEHQLRFSQVLFFVMQMFYLVPTEQGSFYVQNDIFRLNYG